MDMRDPQARPYFLWSEDMTVGELRAVLRGERGPFLQAVYMGRILREARMRDVWEFLTPQQIVEHWPQVTKHLGRRKRYWEFLLGVWREHGLISG